MAPEQGEEDGVGAVPVRPELRVPAVGPRAPQAGHLGEHGWSVQDGHIVPLEQDVGYDRACFAGVRGARNVGHRAAWAGRVQGAGQQAPLQAAERGHVRR
jgi:hypothetical protein